MKCLFVVIGFILSNMSLLAQKQLLPDLMPGEIKDWQITVNDRIYDTETLYDYIDGGAELYISYGMDSVLSRIYRKNDVDEIRVEIFDMGLSKNAFGVFSHTRTTNEHQYGQGSQYFPGTLIFWKDRFFVSITANDENEEIKTIINKLAVVIDDKIAGEGPEPEILKCLPGKNMQEDGFIYFHHYIWMNSYYFISDVDTLSIGKDIDAVFAKYGTGDKRNYLLIVSYPDTAHAGYAAENFRNLYSEDKDKQCSLVEDGTWAGCLPFRKYLICVLYADTEEQAMQILNETKAHIDHITN